MEEIKRITKVICEQLRISEECISHETVLTDDLGADSIDLAELAIGLEAEFHIEVPDPEMMELVTVGDIVDYIGSRIMRLP